MKKKILFFGEAVTLAHVVRPLTLAHSLDKTKWDVYFACDEKHTQLLIGSHINYVPLKTISNILFQERLSKGDPLYTYNELETYVTQEIELLESIHPNVVVSDFRISLNISCQLKNIPHVSLAGAQWSPYKHISYPVPELTAVKLLGVSLATLILPKVIPFFFKLHIKSYNRLVKKYRLPTISSLQELYSSGMQVLYMDILSMFNMHPLPANHLFIGPVHWEPNVELPDWWHTLPTDKPIVFITPGSSGDLKAANQLAKTMADMPLTVLIATAGRMPGFKTEKNVYVADFLPGMLTAKKANLVVCNGGNGMVYQSLASGTPVLGFPYNMDQYYIMEALEEKGAGKLIRSGKVTPALVKSSVTELLNNPSYTDAAKKLKTEIETTHTYMLFEKIVVKVADEARLKSQLTENTNKVKATHQIIY